MSRGRSAAPCWVGALTALALLAGCGGGGNGETNTTAAQEPQLSMAQLAKSVEAEAAGFLRRDGTAVHRSLEKFLGPEIVTRVAKTDTECRTGAETASIANPKKYPFACIVEGSADGRGLNVNITLGFVGLKLDGRCWRAANERVSVTSTAPALLSGREAMRPVNRISGCA
jgi:hypothetical protein